MTLKIFIELSIELISKEFLWKQIEGALVNQGDFKMATALLGVAPLNVFLAGCV